MLIYQLDNGGDNTAKVPLGGVIVQSSPASSMAISIANPITYYGSYAVINQAGHSGDLYDYYWTSYSRGTDGNPSSIYWHNAYLDGYIPLRVKSIYDPCPYLYRLPSNGTYYWFYIDRWTYWSYLGGVSWNLNTLGESWLPSLGWRNPSIGAFERTGGYGRIYSSTAGEKTAGYNFGIDAYGDFITNRNGTRSYGVSVRCIEDCDPRADGTPASAGVMKETSNRLCVRFVVG